MFPIHFKLTISTPEELARITAFIAGDYTAAVTNAPKLDKPKAEAPGKPSAATTAPSPRTAEAAPSQPAPSAAAPEKSIEATPPAADAPSADEQPKVAYADLQKAVLILHKMDSSAAVPIAKSLGADTFKALPEAKWAEALRLVTEAIEARKVA